MSDQYNRNDVVFGQPPTTRQTHTSLKSPTPPSTGTFITPIYGSDISNSHKFTPEAFHRGTVTGHSPFYGTHCK